jgi:hypothetical protein
MAAEPAPRRHLQPVDTPPDLVVLNPGTGESTPLADYMQTMQDQIDGLERDIRGWRTRHANLKRDKNLEAREHELWPQGVKLFSLWKTLCKHGRSAFTQDRFWLVLPFLGPQPEGLLGAAERLGIKEEAEPYGPVICEMAVRGAAFEAYETPRKNGSTKRHDGWELIFRDAAKVEEFANRAPIEPKG